MSEPILLSDRDGAILRLTLNRPDKLNPLDGPMLAALSAAFAAAADDRQIRAVVLTGAGRAFSAGADLREPDRPSIEARLADGYNPLVSRMRTLDKPIIAAVNGICAGAACNIALACDIVLAAESAAFNQVFARIGLMPDAGGTYFLPRAIGTPRAVAMSMLAENVPAATAADWGLIWRAVPDADLAAETAALAATLAAGPTRSYAATKRAIYGTEETAFSRALEVEARAQGALSRTADFAEGVAAFLEKRPARFTGA